MTWSPTLPARMPPLLGTLTDEGLRLFFPLAAVYAAAWPFLWVVVLNFDLPLARSVSPSLWHPHEMLIGAFGAALIGFITTAVPEWTDSRGLKPANILSLAALWGMGRMVGILGFDAIGAVGAVADIAWLAGLTVYLATISIRRRTSRLVGFLLWVTLLLLAEATTRFGFLSGNVDCASLGVRLIGLAFLGLLSLALARIYVPVINLVLDPSEATSPYRPHAGRQTLATGLLAAAVLGEILTTSAPVRGYLAIAAGAAFLDRAGEAFIGRRFVRAEILALFASPALAGAGLMLLGASRLGASLPETTGLHIALMGGLGMGVMGVFSIAGLFHTQHKLPFPPAASLALALLVCAVGLRVSADLAPGLRLPVSQYTASSIVWAFAFGIWFRAYWPLLRDPATTGRSSC